MAYLSYIFRPYYQWQISNKRLAHIVTLTCLSKLTLLTKGLNRSDQIVLLVPEICNHFISFRRQNLGGFSRHQLLALKHVCHPSLRKLLSALIIKNKQAVKRSANFLHLLQDNLKIPETGQEVGHAFLQELFCWRIR